MKKNIKRGFTLVELLAVIVILGILLLLAVPATQNVIKNARMATFEEYYLKTLNLIEQKIQEDEVRNKSLDSTTGCYIYNIKTDLGLADTGEYKGYFAVVTPTDSLEIPINDGPIRKSPPAAIAIDPPTYYVQNGDFKLEQNSKLDFLRIQSVASPYYDDSYNDPFNNVFDPEIRALLLWNRDYATLIFTDGNETHQEFIMPYKQFKNNFDGDFDEIGFMEFKTLITRMFGERCSYDTSSNIDSTLVEDRKAYINNELFRDALYEFTDYGYNCRDCGVAASFSFNNNTTYFADPLAFSEASERLAYYDAPIGSYVEGPYTFKRFYGDKPKSTKYDVSDPNSYYSVYMWIEDNGTIYYYSEAPNIMIENASFLFADNWFTSIDVSGINFDETRTAEGMFAYNEILKTIDFGSATFSRLENSIGMFAFCNSLEKIYVNNNWNLKNLENNYYSGPPMFAGCESLDPNYSNDNPNDETYAVIGKYFTQK